MKKLERTKNGIAVRVYKSSDYTAWKNAFLIMNPKKKNIWDMLLRSEKELTRKHFSDVLKSQKKNREDDHFFDLGIFLKDGTLVGGVSIMDFLK